MKHVNPFKFSKSKTDLAGSILIDENSSDEEKNEALEVLANWRLAHSYPMHIFKKRLKIVSKKIDKGALSGQRLKRAPSIIKKLQRKYSDKATMKLNQMQDIAGCRVILSNVSLAEKIYEKHYLKGDLKHKLVNQKNYIQNPKEDGYRSIHLVYKFFSDKKKSIYNGLLVEIQIRSKIQHIWATAVETVDFFTRQAIKSNEGEEKWKQFFKLVSAAFAKMENRPLVPGVLEKEEELFKLIKELEQDLKVITRLEHWSNSIKEFGDLKNKKNAHFFLLELDAIQEKITISTFSKRQEVKALKEYALAEKKIYGKPEYDVVLVGAEINELKKAYPNYFLDTKEFIKLLKEITKKTL